MHAAFAVESYKVPHTPMTVFTTSLDRRSEMFAANAAAMRALVEDLRGKALRIARPALPEPSFGIAGPALQEPPLRVPVLLFLQ